jgi:hypothetical protein
MTVQWKVYPRVEDTTRLMMVVMTLMYITCLEWN